ncbi:MAG: GGDEF domain-containing protein [Bermanella sp.]
MSAQHDEKLTPYSDLAAKPQIKSDILVRLSTFLQTTLDYQKILTLFKREIAAAVLVDGIQFDNQENGVNFSIGHLGTHSCSYQLNAQSCNLGDISFYRSTRFREHELANIEALMGTLVYPLRNAMRYKSALDQAFKDPLTGAGNRIALDDGLKREMELARRHSYDLSLLMLDLDHFKAINDGFGHLVGDEVLKSVVEKIKECIRQTDICFRYGGEEFVVLLNNANIADARLISERIRMSIEAYCLQTDNGPLQATISCGLAILHADDDAHALMDKADKALYKAKRTGRNKVCVYEHPEQAILCD